MIDQSSEAYRLKMQRFHDKESMRERVVAKGDKLLAALGGPATAPLPEPQEPYSHEALIDLIIANPTWTHRQYAAHFGRQPSWFASVLATNAFQEALDPRRHEVTDPSITATMDERLRALTLKGLSVLQQKLEDPKIQESTIIAATGLGVRALGLGTLRDNEAQKRPETGTVADLANALVHRMKTTGVGRLSGPQSEVTDVIVSDGN